MRISLRLRALETTALMQPNRTFAQRSTLHLTEMSMATLTRTWNPRMLVFSLACLSYAGGNSQQRIPVQLVALYPMDALPRTTARSEGSFRPPKGTGLLTPRGLLTRDLESFGPKF